MTYLRQAGAEPFPGYQLVEFLGKGGFGEVWKCQVPGGLFKAIKFVHGENGSLHHDSGGGATQELLAFERVRAIRHPFLLSVERVEIVDGELITVTELADKSLLDRLKECQAEGLPGLPRQELLPLLLEAAEALDVLGLKHGLQHLDIKPGNLFLIGNHLKVADFGLVRSIEKSDAHSLGPVTPLYCSPEVFQGRISAQSDQYSLAIVYQELLTGRLPFDGSNSRQLMLRHLNEAPNLEPLPEGDRPIVARALAKNPAERFPSCQAFFCALAAIEGTASVVSRTRLGAVQRVPAGDTECPAGSVETTPHVDLRSTPPFSPRPAIHAPEQPAAPPMPRIPSDNADAVASAPSAAVISRPRPPAPPPPVSRPLSISGFRLVECLSQNNPGETWKVQGMDGSWHVARVLTPQMCRSGDPIGSFLRRLQEAQHPALPVLEVLPCTHGMVLLARDCEGKTLSQLYQESVAKGLPGIRRNELLIWLDQAGEALDQLRDEHRLWHLGLNPLSVLVEEDGISLTDFGLVHLLCLPTGQPLARCHQRYAAPELLRDEPGDRCDQYSLALLFAEMLTGIHPRPRLPGPGSRGKCRLDLTLFSGIDQQVLEKALNDEPNERFESCTELMAALRGSARPRVRTPPPSCRPAPVLPITELGRGFSGGLRTAGAARRLVEQVFATHGLEAMEGSQGDSYWRPADNALDCRLPVRLAGKTLRLKLQVLCEAFGTPLVHKEDTSFSLRVPVKSGSKSFWGKLVERETGLLVQLNVDGARERTGDLTEIVVRIAPVGATRNEPTDQVKTVALKVIDRLKACLDVTGDERAHLRLPFTGSVTAYPVLSGGAIGEAIQGQCRNLSISGAGLDLSRRPSTTHLYLHFPEVDALSPYALLARVVHIQCRDHRVYEMGVTFPPEGELLATSSEPR